MQRENTGYFYQTLAAIFAFLLFCGLISYAYRSDKRRNEESSIRPSNTFKVYSDTAGTYFVEQVRVNGNMIYVVTQNGRVIGTLPQDFQFEK